MYLTTKYRKKGAWQIRTGQKISPALTDLSSLLHDGEAFIYYFKEVEKIITAVIAPSHVPLATYYPVACGNRSRTHRETRLSLWRHSTRRREFERVLNPKTLCLSPATLFVMRASSCVKYKIKSKPSPRILPNTSSSSIIEWLTRAGTVLAAAVQLRRLSPISRSTRVPKTLRYATGIIYWVISSTNQLSNYRPLKRVSDVSPWTRCTLDTLSPTNKQLPRGWTSEALTSG